jgi:CheY-like chemotaxis protein
VNSPYILITEDDADDRFLLQTAFAEKKYPIRIEFAENGVELIQYLQDIEKKGEQFPVLVLLDLNMPKKDGREALAELKEHTAFKNIPVFVFTTTHNEQEIARCRKLGASRYIVKPVTFDGLLNVIDELNAFALEKIRVQ